MPKIVPFVPSVPHYRFSCTLAERVYLFDVNWNSREGAWYFDIRDAEGTLLRAGVKVVLGTWLASRSTKPEMPEGYFIANDTDNTGEDAGFDDLGERVQVYFYSVTEVGGTLA